MEMTKELTKLEILKLAECELFKRIDKEKQIIKKLEKSVIALVRLKDLLEKENFLRNMILKEEQKLKNK